MHFLIKTFCTFVIENIILRHFKDHWCILSISIWLFDYSTSIPLHTFKQLIWKLSGSYWQPNSWVIVLHKACMDHSPFLALKALWFILRDWQILLPLIVLLGIQQMVLLYISQGQEIHLLAQIHLHTWVLYSWILCKILDCRVTRESVGSFLEW